MTQAMANRIETLLIVLKRIAKEQNYVKHKIIVNKATSGGVNYTKRSALSFPFSKNNPEECENTLRNIPNWVTGSMDDMNKIKTNVDTALNHVKPENSEALEKFLAKAESLKDFRPKFCAPVRGTAFTHAGFRGYNLLHRVRDVPPFLRLQAVNFSTFTMEDFPQHFYDLLHKIAQKENDLDNSGDNVTCKTDTVTVSEGSRTLNSFVLLDDIESCCYLELVDRYNKMQNDFQVAEEHKLAFCKCYVCNPLRLEDTVMNLANNGYFTFDRFKSIDWLYACSAVKQLAKMHALSMAYWKYYPEEFETVMDKYMARSDFTDEYVKRLKFRTSISTLVVDDKNSGKMARFYEIALSDPDTYREKFLKSRRAVLIHGAYKPINLMHKDLKDGKVDIKIVDFRNIQGGSPLTDLIYFIFTGSDEEFRAKYFYKLVEHYYMELCAAMKRLNLEPEEIFCREDFYYELKEKLPYGLAVAVFNCCDSVTKDPVRPLDFHIKRLNGVVNDCVKWGILK